MADLRVELKIPAGLDAGAVLLSDEVLSGVRDSSLSMEREAKNQSPVETGHLRRSISSTVSPLGSKPTGIVSAAANYSIYVEKGTGIFAVNGDGRKTPWTYRRRDGRFITTRGSKPNPFMKRTFELKKQSAKDRIQQAVERAIERMSH